MNNRQSTSNKNYSLMSQCSVSSLNFLKAEHTPSSNSERSASLLLYAVLGATLLSSTLLGCGEVISQDHQVSFEVSSCLNIGEELSCAPRLEDSTLSGEQRAENACLVFQVLNGEVTETGVSRVSQQIVRGVNFSGERLSLLESAEGLDLAAGSLFSVDLYFYAAEGDATSRPSCDARGFSEPQTCDTSWCALRLSQPQITLRGDAVTIVEFRDDRGVCLIEGPACQELTCDDGAQNGAETGVDCGGACRTINSCDDGEGCEINDDCKSGVCAEGQCLAPTCDDNIQNGDEIGVDCGHLCEPCAVPIDPSTLTSCLFDSDCETERCSLDGAELIDFEGTLPDPNSSGRTRGYCVPDYDEDGYVGFDDNCPVDDNADQADLDSNGEGDLCDDDDDGDGVGDIEDNCPIIANTDQLNTDGLDDGGDLCDDDDDDDGVNDTEDNCPLIVNSEQLNTDGLGDGGDACDNDDDEDGVTDGGDNCPLIVNRDQRNTDGLNDGGDLCDVDDDEDGVFDVGDNCPLIVNGDQRNTDGLNDGGDLCDGDDDEDGILDSADNCPLIINRDQLNTDGLADGGDLCDDDDDNDGARDDDDNCRLVANPDQIDLDGDDLGDLCDDDLDGDGVLNSIADNTPEVPDNCPRIRNGAAEDAQADLDGDGAGDACDLDIDGDEVSNERDEAPRDPTRCLDMDLDTCDDCQSGVFAPQADGLDTDGDGVCDLGDVDRDLDGFSNTLELSCGSDPLDAASTPILAQFDYDQDGRCDQRDEDDDNDGLSDDLDLNDRDVTLCSDLDNDLCNDCTSGGFNPNNDGVDTDGDGRCDLGDPDDDNDGFSDADEATCGSDPKDVNDLPLDTDRDDLCDEGVDDDDDGDGLIDEADSCPRGEIGWISNAQTDLNANGCRDSTGEDNDNDNDGVNNTLDTDPNDPLRCADNDGDRCDDCSRSGRVDEQNDGEDFDGDGLCDIGDPDDDNDFALDGDDDNDRDPSQCSDVDSDLCDDCVSGRFAPEDDGDDFESDGLCNLGDPDDDNDQLDDVDETITDPFDPDSDDDGDLDGLDNCPIVFNADQADRNSNGIGDACDDPDEDGVFDLVDNCPDLSNVTQDDFNSDGEGDACEEDAPVAANDVYQSDEDEEVSGNVRANDNDDDDELADLTAQLVEDIEATDGQLTFNADGSFIFNPTPNFTGLVRFTYILNDGLLDSNEGVVTIRVAVVNDPPVAQDDTLSTNEDTTLTVNAIGILANDSDIDGDPLSAVLVTTTTNGSLNLNANGGLIYVPNENFNGADSFTYRANDGDLSSALATVSITVNPVNDPPVAIADTFSTDEDTALNVNVADGLLKNDLDVEGDALSVVLIQTTLEGDLNFNADGSFVYTPRDHFNGIDSFTYKASDGAVSETATVTITVRSINDIPVPTFNTNQTVDEGGAALTERLTATDADLGDTLTFSLNVAPPAGFSIIDSATGEFVFDPSDINYDSLAEGELSVVTINYVVTDAQGANASSNFDIFINGTNDAPVATFDAQQDVNEGDAVLAGALTASDPDNGDSLTFADTTGGVAGFTLTDVSTGTFTFDPSDAAYDELDEGDVVTLTIDYSVTDSESASGNGAFVIVVTGTNDAPVATFVTDSTFDEEDAVFTDNLTATDIDADDTLSFSLDGAVPAGFSLDDTATGAFTFDPSDAAYDSLAQDESTVVTVTYIVTDLFNTSSSNSFDITINGVNDTPVATFDAQQDVNEGDAVLAGALTASDPDNGDSLTFADTTGGVAGFTLTDVSTGAFTFDPSDAAYDELDEGDVVTLTIDYSVTDSESASGNGAFVIVVTGTNDAPVATFVTDSTFDEEDAVFTDNLTATDIDADDTLSFSLDGAVPAGFSLDDTATGAFTFDPSDAAYDSLAQDESTVVTVTYIVTDLFNTSSSNSFDITINGVNDTPVATFDAQQDVNEGDAVLAGALTASDPDNGDSLTFADTTGGVAGFTLTDVSTGAFTFDPSDAAYDELDEGDVVTLTIDYSVTDSESASGNGAFVIVVTGTNDAPVATFVTDSTFDEEDAVFTDNLTATDVDADDTLSFSLDGAAPAGFSLDDAATGAFTFDPSDAAYDSLAQDESTVVTVTYIVTDLFNTSSSNSFDITINGVNDTPVATFDAQQDVNEGDAVLAGALTASDPDNGDSLTFADTTGGVAGFTLTDVSTGAFTFDPSDAAYDELDEGDVVTLTIDYSVTDSESASGNGAFVIVVTGTNDAPVATFVTDSTFDEEDAVFTDNLTATDVDADDTLSFSLDGAAPAGFSLDDAATGAFTFDPSDAAYDSLAQDESTVVTVTYIVTDLFNTSSSNSFDITINGVNDTPVATFDAQQDVNEGDAVLAGALTASDPDNGDSLTFADTTGGVAGFTLTDVSTGAFTFDPSDAAYDELDEGDVVTLTIDYSVTDSESASGNGAFVIVVTGTNDAPVATFVTDSTFDEEDAVFTDNLTATDVDADDTLSFSLDGAAPAGFSLDDAATGAFTFDPSDAAYDSLAQDESTVVTVTYIVTDLFNTSSSNSFDITINGVNDTPVATFNAPQVVDEGDAVINGVLTATDVDTNDTLSFSLDSPVAGFTLLDANWSFDPDDAAYDGLANNVDQVITVNYTVTDDSGAINNSASGSFTITVTGRPN